MGIENKDVIRHEDTTLLLPSTSKPGQVTFELDGTERQRREMLINGKVLHWTPDENFSSEIIKYENPELVLLTNVKETLDYFVEKTKIEPIFIVDEKVGIGTTTPTEILDISGNCFVSNRIRIGIGNSVPDENYNFIVSGNSILGGDLEINGKIIGKYSDLTISNNTIVDDDYRKIIICGGGEALTSRGGLITINGNDEISNPGYIFISSGEGNGYVTGKIILNGSVNFQNCTSGNVPFVNSDKDFVESPINTNGTLVGIGTNYVTAELDVNGNGRFRSIGSYASAGALHYDADGFLTVSTSDARLKHDIKSIDELTIQKLLDLNPVSFKWNGTEKDSIGLIAQEVREVLPELVFENKDGFFGVHYDLLSVLLIKALKKQNKTVIDILERLERLEKLENN